MIRVVNFMKDEIYEYLINFGFSKEILDFLQVKN